MTKEEKEIALYCLKASSDYHLEVCEECVKYPNCDHTIQDDVTETIIKALEQPTSDDCVSRAEVLNLVRLNAFHVKSQIKAIENMPPVTPTHGTCKDCRHCRDDFSFTDKPKCLLHGLITVNDDFYCRAFKKRGSEDGSN